MKHSEMEEYKKDNETSKFKDGKSVGSYIL